MSMPTRKLSDMTEEERQAHIEAMNHPRWTNETYVYEADIKFYPFILKGNIHGRVVLSKEEHLNPESVIHDKVKEDLESLFETLVQRYGESLKFDLVSYSLAPSHQQLRPMF